MVLKPNIFFSTQYINFHLPQSWKQQVCFEYLNCGNIFCLLQLSPFFVSEIYKLFLIHFFKDSSGSCLTESQDPSLHQSCRYLFVSFLYIMFQVFELLLLSKDWYTLVIHLLCFILIEWMAAILLQMKKYLTKISVPFATASSVQKVNCPE